MFNYESVLTLVALVSSAWAAPAPIAYVQNRVAEDPSVLLCYSVVPTLCVTTPVVSDDCVDMTGAFSFLNKEIAGAVIPNGFICTFFQ
ncbi:hypothetical protein B0H11DRAFT_2284330 [Mycena galericulata]|nr:hypothetical protein B0H11DRAFT_2284330 [Mycena galericulata]